MTTLERTRQQLDPVGTQAARAFAIVLAATALLNGIVMTLLTPEQTVNPLLAILALVWLGGAAFTVAIASSSRRAPFTAATHTVVQLLAFGSILLSTASQWGANRYVQDDFGSISLGLLIVAMCVYRPASELARFGALAAIFVGFITLLKVPGLDTDAPAAMFVLAGMTPVLALSFGSAAYSARLVRELDDWQQRAARSVEVATSRLVGGIEKSVRLDRAKILDRDVFPFFNMLLSKETVTDDDRARARAISDSIRVLMVADADRTWLEVVARDDGVAPSDMQRSVVDAHGRAVGMVVGQRTVLRALINALREHETFVPQSLIITISGTKDRSSGVLVASIRGNTVDPQDSFAPYFAVMRVVFSELQVEFHDNKLTVRFSYEQC